MNDRSVAASERARAAGPCLTCVVVSLGLVAAIVASFAYLAIDYRELVAGVRSLRRAPVDAQSECS